MVPNKYYIDLDALHIELRPRLDKQIYIVLEKIYGSSRSSKKTENFEAWDYRIGFKDAVLKALPNFLETVKQEMEKQNNGKQ
jgi:hypothetical protein